MIFKFNKWKVIAPWSIIGLLILLNLLDLGFKLYQTIAFVKPFDPSYYVQCGYVGLAIWYVWYLITLIGRRIEVSGSEIKLINRSDRVVKSRRFDDISDLKFGAFVTPPRDHWIVFTDGEKWNVSRYLENFEVLIQKIEDRTGKSFVEPITTRKLKPESK